MIKFSRNYCIFSFLKVAIIKSKIDSDILKLKTDRDKLSISGILSGTDETSERTAGFMYNISNYSMTT